MCLDEIVFNDKIAMLYLVFLFSGDNKPVLYCSVIDG